MRICIYGAGAIGAWLGAQMSLSGEDVTLIARGPHLNAMKKNGVKVLINEQEITAFPKCVQDPRDAGPQDYVFISVKSYSLNEIIQNINHLFDKNTAVITGINGIPWWYFYKLKGPYENHNLKAIDPDGKIWKTIDPKRAIGCVVYPAAEIMSPGIIKHIEGDRFILGINFRVDIERRLRGGAEVGPHKTSMLQDLESKKPMEIDALITSVKELGELVKVPTPTIDIILALIQQRARIAGTY